MSVIFLKLLLLANYIGSWIVSVVVQTQKTKQRLSKAINRGVQKFKLFLHVHISQLTSRIKKTLHRIRRAVTALYLGLSKKIHRSLRLVKTKLVLIGTTGLVVGVGLVLISKIFVTSNLVVNWDHIPNPRTIDDFQMPAATLIYDQNDVLLYSSYSDINRVPVGLNSIPPFMITATLAAEDKRFYQHRGIDLLASIRASAHNLFSDQKQGGSTLTQQVARSVFLTRDKTLSRKTTEALIALRMERNLTKDQILELYFNTVSYGGNAIGVEAASWQYFGKHVSELTDKEIIFLVSTTPAPTIYGRDHRPDNPHIQYVLTQMKENKKITQERYQELLAEPINFTSPIAYKRAPHAVDFILSQLEDMYDQNTLNQGLIVKSSIDLETQNTFQKMVSEEVALHSKSYRFSNAAALVASPQDGRVISMVGSADYFNPSYGQVNLTTSLRQLGSTMKIVPYSYALENGFSPETIIADVPTKFKEYNDYEPKNYDSSFHGNITLKQAFANSYNVPALKVTHELGVSNVAEFGATMGVTELSHLDSKPPLSLAIGGVETSLLHLTQAYQIIANNGNKVPISLIDSVTNYQGQLLYSHQPQATPVVTSKTASTIFDILSDTQARQSAFGRPSYFDFKKDKVALKSGTSNDLRDNVTFSFTPSFVVATWVGNNDSSSMRNVASGYSGASVIMHKITNHLLTEQHITSNSSSQIVAERR